MCGYEASGRGKRVGSCVGTRLVGGAREWAHVGTRLVGWGKRVGSCAGTRLVGGTREWAHVWVRG